MPRTPSTPGRERAVARRSTSAVRDAIARGSSRTARAPRAGWSAATRRSRPSGARVSRRRRCDQARATPRGRRSAARWWTWRRGADAAAHDAARSARRSSTSSSVGMAVEHSSREATMAPAALANRTVRSRSAGEQAVAHRAAERVTGPEAVGDVDGHGRHLDPVTGRRDGQDALGPRRRRRARPRGRAVPGRPTPGLRSDRDAALLEVADGDGARGDRLGGGRWPRPRRARTSGGSRGRPRCARSGPASPRRSRGRCGSARRTAR